MKLVDRKEFLQLPEGTIFQKYTPCVIESHLSIKGKNCGDNDWWVQPLNAVDASCNLGIGEYPTGVDLHCEMRDGEYNDEQLFLIWERDEVIRLIDRLKETC